MASLLLLLLLLYISNVFQFFFLFLPLSRERAFVENRFEAKLWMKRGITKYSDATNMDDTKKYNYACTVKTVYKNYPLDQCFSTFFGSRHPIRLKRNLATPLPGPPFVVNNLEGSKFNICRHPCVSRHPGWEPLL